ncbi:MAG: hypothetical protein IKX57_06135 [Oscillospiraceae bacterium]|nr:hypothetical protein [Oscillospiraceae bacterium]
MARNRFALCCALRHIFFNDYGLEKTFIMSDLLALTAYYSDQNTPPEILSNQKKLHLWLTRAELIKKLGKEDEPDTLNALMHDLELINLNAMLQYVKGRALESGDLSLQHIKGDNDKW